jgi:hypothetical protein
MTNIGICHWDGYENINTKCSLITGAVEAKKLGSTMIKIYAGNKSGKNYRDLEKYKNIECLVELLKTEEYSYVFNSGFTTIVIVAFTINSKKDDDYWRISGPDDNESIQYKEACKYLSENFSNIEFILSNWESDCVLEIYDEKKRELVANNIIKLINIRQQAAEEYKNIKISLEVNKFYDGKINSMDYVIPQVNCAMISYSCYQTLWKSPELLDSAIKYITKHMKTGVELYIGEFGFAINKQEKNNVLFLLNSSINVFRSNNIRLAFYWNLYNNERHADGSFNGFGIIDIYGNQTYVCNKLFHQNSIFMFVRHGKSKANEWKLNNKVDYINHENALLHNLYDPELCLDGITNVKNERMNFWSQIVDLASNRPITIYLSPLKRTIQTCLLLMTGFIQKYYYNYFINIKIIITPLLAEIGSSKENKLSNLEDIKLFVALQPFICSIEYLHLDSYDDIMLNGSNVTHTNKFTDYLKSKHTKEFILCFSHWNVIKKISNKSVSNFGDGNDYGVIL